MQRPVLIILVLLLLPVAVLAQSRTADRFQPATVSTMDSGNPPLGAVRWVSDARRQNGLCTAASPGETPIGADAVKTPDGWMCSSRAAGAGTGNMVGPASSSDGELVLFDGITGKITKRSSGLTGIASLSAGVVSALGSTGSGNVVRTSSPSITTPTLITPLIADFQLANHSHSGSAGGGQLNASNVFNAGTIPPSHIISGAIVNSRCLRVSNVGQIEVAAADCGTGGGGTPGGVSGNFLFNESGSVGGIANSAYDSVTGRSTFTQKANGNDTLNLLRFTDTAPTGTLIRLRNAANSSDLFSVSATGAVSVSSTLTYTLTAAPSTPAAGFTTVWADSTGKNLRAQDDAGNVSGTVRAVTCSGTDKISAISSAGVVTCTADQGGSGTGVITLNTLVTSDQTFADVDDTNVTLAISSATSTHTFTIGWTGTLAKARQHAATVYNDQANTWSTGAQSFAAATSLISPLAAGAVPTANGSLAYDTTGNTLEYGENGTNRIVANTAGAQTFSNKTLDNSVTANLKDTQFTLQDNGDASKTVNFELSGITSSTNRVVTIANAASVTVQPTTLTTNQFVTHIDSAGVVQKAQPSFANLSGSMGPTQGGTGLTSYTQGDLLYADATNSLAKLPKSASATRYLSNTGASNNPAWAQVDLTNGVTGVLPPANWSVATTKGDLVTHNGTTTVRKAVGTNGFVVTANSAIAEGWEWAAVSASAAGSTTQLQRNNAGSLGGISGATSDGTSVTFGPANLIIGGQSATPTAVAGALYRDTDDTKLYYAIDGSTWGEVFVSGVSVVNLASANVSGVLPLANGGTNQSSWTASRCVQVNSGGTALESAASACGGGGTPGGSDTQVQYNDGGAFGGDAGMTYNETTNTLSVEVVTLTGTGAGYLEMAEGTAPSAVANRVTVTAPTNVTAAGWVLSLPTDDGASGQFLQTDGNGVTTWAAPSGSGTVTATGGSLTANSVVLGAGTTDTKVVAGIITDGTSKLTLGVAGTSVGSIDFKNATSGTITLAPVTGALGTVTLSLPARTDTLVTLGGTETLAAKTLVTPTITGAANWDDNTRQTFNPGGTQPGLNVGAHTADPSSLLDGDIWINSTAAELRARINGATVALGAGGGGGANAALSNLAAVAINTSLISDTNDTDDLGSSSIRWQDIYGMTLDLGGSGAGYVELAEGSAPSLVANRVQHVAAADAPAGGTAYIWGAAAGSGILRVANSSGTMTVTQDAGISHLASSTSAALATVLSDEEGTAGGFVRATSPTLTTPALGVATATSINGLTITSSTGTLTIANGKTLTVNNTLTFVGTDGTTMTFPATSGAVVTADSTSTFTNKTMDTEGTGNTLTSTFKPFLPAAGCNNTTASSFWDLFTATPAVAACVTGTVVTKGVLDFADTSGGFTAQYTIALPSDITGAIDADILWTTTATSGNVEWSLATICTATDATETDDPGAFNTASTVVTAAPGVANRVQTSSISSVSIPGCAANELLHLRLFRDGNDAQDTLSATARFIGMKLTIRRQQ